MPDWLNALRDAPEPDGALVDRALAARPKPRPWRPYALAGLGIAGASVVALALNLPKPPQPAPRQTARAPQIPPRPALVAPIAALPPIRPRQTATPIPPARQVVTAAPATQKNAAFAPPQRHPIALRLAMEPPTEDLRRIVGGYRVESLRCTLQGETGVGDTMFFRNNVSEELLARVTLNGHGLYQVDGSLFDKADTLLTSTHETVALRRGDPGQIDLNFGAVTGAAHCRISVRTLSANRPADSRTLTFLVGTVRETPDGGWTVTSKPTRAAREEILKNPALRDQQTLVVPPTVRRALEAAGPVDWKDATVRVRGKVEEVDVLTRPAYVIQTVTVAAPTDLDVLHLPLGPYPTAAETPAERVAKLDALRTKGESVYDQVIGPEFDRLVNEAAKSDHAALIALIQHAWFGGPKDAPKGGNAITWAAYYPTADPVRSLLAQGVAPGVADATGKTGLHRTYREEIARLLLDKGAKVEARDADGKTPLIAQAQAGNPWMGRGIVALLLERGADPNAVDRSGKTALMYAAAAGMADDVAALLAKGADPKRRDRDGKTALDLTKPWAWQMSPGFATQEILDQQRQRAEADADRIRGLLPR